MMRENHISSVDFPWGWAGGMSPEDKKEIGNNIKQDNMLQNMIESSLIVRCLVQVNADVSTGPGAAEC